MAIHSSLVDPAAPVVNAECVAISQCSKDVHNHLVYCKISDDIAVDSESKLLLTRAGRWFSFRHYKSSKTNFSLDIFLNSIGIFISGIFETEESHLKITVCPRHRNLLGLGGGAISGGVRSPLLRRSMPTGENP